MTRKEKEPSFPKTTKGRPPLPAFFPLPSDFLKCYLPAVNPKSVPKPEPPANNSALKAGLRLQVHEKSYRTGAEVENCINVLHGNEFDQ